MAKPDIMLYWGSGSVPCWRVMIALEEKGLEYKDKLLEFSKKEHKGSDVMAINPRGQLPSMTVDGIVINESMAACLYLQRLFKDQGNDLMPPPAEKAETALALQRMTEALNVQKVGAEQLVRYLFTTKPEDRDQELLKTKKENLIEELQRWEDYLKQQGEGKYLAGKNFTLADVIFYPLLAIFVRVGAELKPKFPCLASYYDLVTPRPSVQKTWPPHWKGTDRGALLKDLY